jgi:hypothetical protein
MAYFDHFIKADGGNTIVMQNKHSVLLFRTQKRRISLAARNPVRA